MPNYGQILKKALFTHPVVGIAMAHFSANAQGFESEWMEHPETHKNESLTTTNSPLKAGDLPCLLFYVPDSRYRLVATHRAGRDEF